MALTKENYKRRLVDDKIEKYLKIFGAVLIEGPKWCGKTWSSLNHSESVTYLTDKNTKELAKIDPKYIFNEKTPELIDEWQIVPQVWDAVRHACDSDTTPGKFILTGSTTLEKNEEENVYHTGTGRIAPIRMYPMSLYESGDSTGEVSIMDMYNGNVEGKHIDKVELDKVADLIIRGGWPANIEREKSELGIMPKVYIDSIIKKDIHERKDKKRDERKMQMLLKSLSRNESSTASYDTIVKDIEIYENEEELIESRQTVSDYINVLNDLFLIVNQASYDINYRSSKRIGKSAKRHLVDPSLACASLNLTREKLLQDLNTFGFMFESLVERDLRIYMEYLDGELYHFRDNTSGDEVDAILEFSNGEYAACEIKLSPDKIEEAKNNLLKFYNYVEKKPKFMCIIVGYYEAIVYDKENNIYILPITALKP